MTRARISGISTAVATLVLGVGIVIAAAPQQKPSSPTTAETLMGAALHQEEVEGNVEAAIATYKRVIADARASRSLKATALLHLGQSYEKLGHAEARKAYERLVREFADQTESAAVARARLAGLTRQVDGARAARQVWETDTSLARAAISPDGRYLVYVRGRDGGGDPFGQNRVSALYATDLRTGLNHRLTAVDGTGDVSTPTFSPDGKSVLYSWITRGPAVGRPVRDLRLVGMDGSAPRVLRPADAWEAISGYEWSADGKQLLGLGRRTGTEHDVIVLVSVADGSVREIKSFATALFTPFKMMTLSRDGRYVVYDNPALGNSGQRDIFIVGTEGDQTSRPLVARPADDSQPIFTPDGRGVVFLGRATDTIGAWHQRIADGRPQGSPELLKADLGRAPIPIGFTSQGAFYYAANESTTTLFAATLDAASGAVLVQPAPVTRRFVEGAAAWSPDGRYLAYASRRPAEAGAAAAQIIVIRSLDTGEERELAPALGNLRLGSGAWSAQGRSLLVGGTDKSGRNALYEVDAQTGAAVQILDRIPSHFTWLHEGKAILFIRSGAIVSHDLQSGRATELYRPSAPALLGPCVEVSRDGRSLAFYVQDPETRSMRVMVMAVQGQSASEWGTRVQYPERIDDILALTPDGRSVLYTTYDLESAMRVHKVWTVAADGGVPQEIRLPMERLDFVRTGNFHPDGRQIVFPSSPYKQVLWAMENFLPKPGAAR